ncbi:MAG: DUF1697 domain-containing protein [Gemmatimonadaceae bacterium]
MPTYIALLRAVNVGGTGKLPMAELRGMCADLGFTDVATYIQSGNVVFSTRLAAAKAKAALERALAVRLGKPSAVILRTRDELEAVERARPFPDAAPNQLLVLFLDATPDAAVLKTVKIPGREKLRLIGRELFIHFPDGMGQSKLKIPFADLGTGRNLNTVRALLALSGQREGA